MRRPLILCLFAAASLTWSASAQEFLPAEQQDFSQVLPLPPADTAPAGLADLDTVLQLQKERTPAQVARAHRVSRQTLFSFAQPVLGEWFTAQNLPRTAAIFTEIDREDGPIVQAAKHVAHRPRPYQRDLRVVPAVSRPGMNDSYPSGHTAGAALWAAVLTAAFPEDGPAFQDQLHETMWCRELGGVHYPTDTEAGALIGHEVARRMLASPNMGKALAEIRAEAVPFQSQKAVLPVPPAQSATGPLPSSESRSAIVPPGQSPP